MIRVNALSKQFGSFQAVDGISFEVQRGEVLGFLGPNGAGKSTTMRMLTCYLPPSSGSAEVNGFSIQNQPLQVQENVGYLPESAPSYNEMQVEEFLNFIAEVRGYGGSEQKRRVAKVLELTALQDAAKQIIDTLSKGYRQRTCLAQALLHEPPVLILDEPTAALDPQTEQRLVDALENAAKDHLVIVIAHRLSTIRHADLIIFLEDGQIVDSGSEAELMARADGPYRTFVELQQP